MDKFQAYFEAALAIHAAASVICATTKTPKDDQFLRKIYRFIEIVGLVIGHAKER